MLVVCVSAVLVMFVSCDIVFGVCFVLYLFSFVPLSFSRSLSPLISRCSFCLGTSLLGRVGSVALATQRTGTLFVRPLLCQFICAMNCFCLCLCVLIEPFLLCVICVVFVRLVAVL